MKYNRDKNFFLNTTKITYAQKKHKLIKLNLNLKNPHWNLVYDNRLGREIPSFFLQFIIFADQIILNPKQFIRWINLQTKTNIMMSHTTCGQLKVNSFTLHKNKKLKTCMLQIFFNDCNN